MSKIVYQHGTMAKFVPGLYDGTKKLVDILKEGDTGLGTGDGMDGELIIIKGIPLRVTSTGEVAVVPEDEMIPFCTVHFADFSHLNMFNQIERKELEQEILELTHYRNIIFAIKIEGTFSSMKTRTVIKQHKPYAPLNELEQKQVEFEKEQVVGTLISYYFPELYNGLNVSGFHHHFLADDHSIGGHVLDFVLEQGEISIQSFDTFVQQNPIHDKEFLEADYSLFDLHDSISNLEN